jgi:hypothetical protein
MGEKCANLAELLAHMAWYSKCVILDAENTVFLAHLYRDRMVVVEPGTLVTANKVEKRDILCVVTLGATDDGNPVVYGNDLLQPIEEGHGKAPVFPVNVLANR